MPKGFTPLDDTQATPGFTPVDETPSAQAQPPTAAAPAQSSWMDYPKEIYQGVKRGVTGMVEGAREGMQPRTPGEETYNRTMGSISGPLGLLMKHSVEDTFTGLDQANRASWAAKDQGYGLAGQTLALGENLPMVGGAVKYAESGGTQMFNPKSVGAAAELTTYAEAPKVVGAATRGVIDLPKEVNDFARRAKSMNDVTQAGAGLYQGKIQPTIQTLQGVIEREGSKTIEQAIQADKDAQVQAGRGSISAAPAIAEAAKTMEQSGYIPEPKTRNLLTRLNSQTEMTLEDAKNLRSDLGRAAARATDARTKAVLWSAYDQLGDGMASRIEELQGTREPFDHYNNEFRAAFNLEGKGVTKSMLEPLADRHDSIPKLKEFANADLTEIKQQMKQYGLKAEDIDKAQKDAQALVNAHDAIGGKYRKGLYRVILSGGIPAAAAASIYAASQGAGLYGMVPLAVAAYVGGKIQGWPEQMEAGRILRNLKIKPEDFQVRPQVEGPKSFSYKNPDEGWSAPTRDDLAERVKTAKAARKQ